MESAELAMYAGDPNFMMSLGRGLLVLKLLAGAERPMTLADVSRRSGLSRAAARRCLYTLGQLGYVAPGIAGYVIHNDVLALGRGFMNPESFAVRSQPLLDALRDQLGESCSIGVLEQDHVRYVARSEASRIMSINLRVGSRLPLYATSMGRVLLAGQPVAGRQAYLDRVALTALTPLTVTDKARLTAILLAVERDGHAIIDQELELGLRSVSVPILSRNGVIAAINASTSTARVKIEDLRARYVPALANAAREIAMLQT